MPPTCGMGAARVGLRERQHVTTCGHTNVIDTSSISFISGFAVREGNLDMGVNQAGGTCRDSSTSHGAASCQGTRRGYAYASERTSDRAIVTRGSGAVTRP